MKASSLSFRTATLFAIAGMSMGIAMAASGNHAPMPAHAHLNLLGWVSLFLFGIYYRLNPATDVSRLALVQVGVWSIGTVALTIAVAAIYLGHPEVEPFAAASSFVLLAGMVLFAFLVFRPAVSDRRLGPVLTPAE